MHCYSLLFIIIFVAFALKIDFHHFYRIIRWRLRALGPVRTQWFSSLI